jgi:hypothetical protein
MRKKLIFVQNKLLVCDKKDLKLVAMLQIKKDKLKNQLNDIVKHELTRKLKLEIIENQLKNVKDARHRTATVNWLKFEQYKHSPRLGVSLKEQHHLRDLIRKFEVEMLIYMD